MGGGSEQHRGFGAFISHLIKVKKRNFRFLFMTIYHMPNKYEVSIVDYWQEMETSINQSCQRNYQMHACFAT